MLTVAIKDNGEKGVIEMTYEDLWKELKDISGSELVVVDDWFDVLQKTKNPFICFVESDCLVSSGYFKSMTGILNKNKNLLKVGALGSALGVINWANRVYGYQFGNNHSQGIIPNRSQASNRPYPVQVAYIPGAVMRTKMLKNALGKQKVNSKNLVELSIVISLRLWRLKDSPRVALNPSTTYVTTEKYPLDIIKSDIDPGDVLLKFKKAGIR